MKNSKPRYNKLEVWKSFYIKKKNQTLPSYNEKKVKVVVYFKEGIQGTLKCFTNKLQYYK